MHEIDQAVKKVCALYPNCILDLFYGKDRTVELKGVEDAQLQIPEHRADKLWRVRQGENEACILVEAITEPDRRDFPRINLKNAAARVILKTPVITVLVYLQEGKYAIFPDGYREEFGGFENSHTYARILLWEHADRIRSGELKELAPFLALFENDPPPEILEEENRIIETIEDPELRAELKGVAAIIAARKFNEEIIRQYLTLEDPMIREKTFFTEWLDQERTKGIAEGQTKERRLLLRKMLPRKFGLPAQEIKDMIRGLDGEQLELLALEFFELQTVDDLKKWLENAELETATS